MNAMNVPVLTAVAWPYANGPRHIGHVSGFGVPSDVFSRYQRMVGNRVLMVSGTDEHGTPIQVQADAEGSTPRELVDKYSRVIQDDLVGLGLSVRPVHAHEHRQPPPRHAGPLQRAVEERLRPHREDPRRDQPVDRPHAARPLHRGHLPDLRLPQRARRPVRQLRQPARPRRPDHPAQPDQRRDPAVRRDRAPAVRPPGVLAVARVVARDPDALAAERPELQQAPGRRPQAPRDQPRPRLGRAHPAGRLARPADEAVLRLVRRRDRLPVGVGGVGAAHRRPGRVEAVVVRPGRAVLLLHGQGQHHLPLGDVARDPARAQRRGRPRRRGRAVRPAQPAHRGRQLRVPDDERLEVLHQPRHRHLRRGLPARVRARRAALLHRGRRPGEPGQRLHLGRVRPAHQLRAGQRVGQPRQPLDLAGVQERRRDPGADVAGPGRRGPARAVAGRVRHRRRPPRAVPVQAGDLRGDADRRRGERLPVAPGALEAQGRPGAPRHDPAHRPAGRAGREHPAHAVPAARRAEGARGARGDRRVGRAAAPRGRGPLRRARHQPLGAHRRLRLRAGALGVDADPGGPAAGQARRRCSPSSTRRWARPGRPGRPSRPMGSGKSDRQCPAADPRAPRGRRRGGRPHPPRRLRGDGSRGPRAGPRPRHERRRHGDGHDGRRPRLRALGGVGGRQRPAGVRGGRPAPDAVATTSPTTPGPRSRT